MPTRSRPHPPKRIRRDPARPEREILDAAERFLGEHDARDLSVEALMRATGMQRSSFYHYFRDRGAVILRLLEEIQDEITEAADLWLRDPGSGDPAAALTAGITASAEVWARHRHVLRALHNGAALDPLVEEAYRGVLTNLTDAIAARLRSERRRGRTPVQDTHHVAQALNLMNAMVFAERLGRDPADTPAAVSATVTPIWISTIYPEAATSG